MPVKIEIPVEVVGAEQAQQHLRAVAAAAGEVGGAKGQADAAQQQAAATAEAAAAQQQAAAATAEAAAAAEAASAAQEQLADNTAEQAQAATAAAGAAREQAAAQGEAAGSAHNAATNTQRATQSANQFGGAARTMVTQVASGINPSLGRMVSILTSVANGISTVSLGLLGMAGAGLVLSAIIGWFERLRKAAEDARNELVKSLDKWRETQQAHQSLRERTAEEFLRAGINPALAQQAARNVETGPGRNVPREWAIAGEVARLRGGLDDAGVEEVLAGIAASGGKTPEWKGSDVDRRTIERLREAGRKPEAQEFLRGARQAFAGGRLDEAIPQQPEDPVEEVLARLKDREKLTPAEVEAARRILNKDVPTTRRQKGTLAKGPERPAWEMPADAGWFSGTGGDRTYGEIDQLLRDAIGEARDRIPQRQPVTVNITNVTNVQTQYNTRPQAGPWLQQPSPEHAFGVE